MAGPGTHPIHIHPARPLYRFAATGLGATMWFFLMYALYLGNGDGGMEGRSADRWGDTSGTVLRRMVPFCWD